MLQAREHWRRRITEDERYDPVSPLDALKHLWPLAVILVILGGAGGVIYARSQPTSFTADGTLSVGATSLSAQAVPGFALASQELASNYARYVSPGPVLRALRPVGRYAVSDITSIAASPISDSNVIIVETKATSATAAIAAGNEAASLLKNVVNAAVAQTNPTVTLSQYTALSQQVSAAQGQLATDNRALTRLLSPVHVGSTSSLHNAQLLINSDNARLAVLSVQQAALGAKYQTQLTTAPAADGLMTVATATISTTDRTSREERYGLAGAVIGLLVATIIATLLQRRKQRVPKRSDATPYQT